MTKARDLANVISGGFTADDIPNIDASKITTGTFDASRIGSGTFADARISASSVSQHATSFDDNKIVNDISTLALRQASDQNKSAYNTNSSFVDVFQDSTGITNLTNSARNNGEYMQSGISSAFDWDTLDTVTGANGTATVIGTQNLANGTVLTITDNVSYSSWKDITNASEWLSHSNGGTSSGYALGHLFDFKGDVTMTAFYIGRRITNGEVTSYKIETSTDGSNFSLLDLSSATASTVARYDTNGGNTTGNGDVSSMTSGGIINFSTVGNVGGEYGWLYKIENFTSFSARYIRATYNWQYAGNNNAGAGRLIPVGTVLVLNATGSFENVAITAPSSVSSMGAIITYQDNAGTNALNTDIVLQLSADGGSNWSTATLSALPNFATGIKMAKVNDLAVTAGTNLKYKISFANQASGSKEARIRGVALQY